MSYSAKSRPTSFLHLASWSLRIREGSKDDVVGGIGSVLAAKGDVIEDAALIGCLAEDLGRGGRITENPDHQDFAFLGAEE